MKKINIYLIANETELQKDEKEIGNFIRDLNDKYEDYNIYFKLIADENAKVINEEEIENSELFFILFYKNIDENSINKFNIAYDNFKNNKNPKISTYVKKSDEPAGQSVIDFMKTLDEELGHYYSVYENIDTIKLNIVLRLQTLGLSVGQVETRDGKLYIGEKEIMTLENIPIIFNNKELNELKKEAEDIEDEYWKMKEIMKNDIDNERIISEFEKVKENRKRIKESIFQLEKNIIELQSSFVKISSEGNLSRRQIYAQKCLEQGDIEAAKETLNLAEIKDEADKILELQDAKKYELQIKVNELIQRVDTLMLDMKNENRFKEIETTFEEAIRIEKQGGLYRKSILTYAKYLLKNKKYQNSIEISKSFLKYVEADEITDNLKDMYNIYNILGISYSFLKNYEETEIFLLKEIETAEKMQDYEKISSSYYDIINLLYEKIEEYEKAEQYYKKIIKIYENNIKSEAYLAKSYKNLAFMYEKIKKYEEAEKYFQTAININKKLVTEKNDETLKEELYRSYKELSNVYIYQNKYVKASELITNISDIRKELSKSNPKRYMEEEENDNYIFIFIMEKLIRSNIINFEARKAYSNIVKKIDTMEKAYALWLFRYHERARECQESNKQKNAKKYLEKLKNTLLKLEKIIRKHASSDMYENLNICAKYYGKAGRLYENISQYIDAEICYKEEIKLRLEIEDGSLCRETSLLWAYYHIIKLYEKIEKYEEIEKYYKLAIAILEKLVKEMPEIYKPELSTCYCNIALAYHRMKKYEEAEKYYKKSIEMKEEIAQGDMDKYIELGIDVVYGNIANLYKTLERNEEAAEYTEKAKLIKEGKMSNE